MVPAERRELLAGDVPLFTTRLDGRDLLGAEGRRWPEFFERSGLDLVSGRLAELGEGDLARQVWFVRASLAAHHVNLYGTEDFEVMPGAPPAGTANAARLLEAAAAVGNRLEALALSSEGDSTWIGLRSQQGRDWRLSPLGSDLYSGLPGVAVFLAYLAEVTGEERHRRLARAAWQTVWTRRESLRSVPTLVGGFDGWGGLIWTLTHLAWLWSEPAYLNEAHAIVELLPGLIAQDETFDVVHGAAGCIAGLLALHRVESDERALKVAALCGEHLLARAQTMERGAAWMSEGMRRLASQPLAGFAHGASGVAWALLELAAACGERRYQRAAFDALDYERTLFIPA
jgi:type 2 lantibiotic biosynthesis protein LanM